eukprot:g5393.t1
MLIQKGKETDDITKLPELKKMIAMWFNEGEGIAHYYVNFNKPTIISTYYSAFSNDPNAFKLKNPQALTYEYANKKIITASLIDENNRNGPKAICPFQAWIQSSLRNTVDEINYSPAHYFQALREGRSPHSYGFFNTFTGFAIPYEEAKKEKPYTEEEIQQEPFFKHIRMRWCSNNPQLFEKVMCWFASIYQRPHIKLNMALVLLSPQRSQRHENEVLGSFNGQMTNKSLVFLDEIMWGGNKTTSGVLKKLITEKRMSVNEKFVPSYSINNLINLVLASNEDWAVPVGITEQRFQVLKLDPELSRMDEPTKVKTIKDILSIDRHRLAHTLLLWDLSEFNDREVINTAGLREQKIHSLSAVNKWFMQCLDRGHINDPEGPPMQFGTTVCKDRVYNAFTHTLKKDHTTTTGFWLDIQKILGDELEQKRRKDPMTGARKLWVVLPSLEECRAKWCVFINDENWEFDGEFDETDDENEDHNDD